MYIKEKNAQKTKDIAMFELTQQFILKMQRNIIVFSICSKAGDIMHNSNETGVKSA